MSKAMPYPNATADLRAMLATADIHGDLYDSYYEIPCQAKAFSTDWMVVRRGEGSVLKHFLQSPVHTSPDPAHPDTRTLPGWMYKAIEQYVVAHGHHNSGYVFELVGKGDPWIRWVLQRLRSRRSMRFHPFGPLALRANLTELASEFQLAYWTHDVHFVMRMNAFRTEPGLQEWVEERQANVPIDRAREHRVLEQSVPAGGEAKPWFESMGYLKQERLDLDDAAKKFAFGDLSNWRLFMACFSRGPDDIIFRLLNAPVEWALLHRDGFKSGSLLTKFYVDLRLEIYAESAVAAPVLA